MRHVTRSRTPHARYTRQSIHEQRVESRTGREQGPRGSRILHPKRSGYALRSEVVNMGRSQWRNFDWCMSRVCNVTYQR